jgi:hypothetical protein
LAATRHARDSIAAVSARLRTESSADDQYRRAGDRLLTSHIRHDAGNDSNALL